IDSCAKNIRQTLCLDPSLRAAGAPRQIPQAPATRGMRGGGGEAGCPQGVRCLPPPAGGAATRRAPRALVPCRHRHAKMNRAPPAEAGRGPRPPAGRRRPLRRAYTARPASVSRPDGPRAQSPGGPAPHRRRGASMLDTLLLILGLGGFALMGLYVAACDRV
ncbi:hypothetical protein HMPREF0731_0125, partial [Pseudoroseomonas cervicalis ATCC 49957]